MKLSEIFSGNYLKSEDLQGRTVPVTISKVELKEFDDGKKLVIHFEGKDKVLVCNRTNASIIEDNLRTDETDRWIGKQICLTVKKVEFQGKLVPAIRVLLQDTAPVQAPPTTAPAPAPPVELGGDEVPF
jgi:hypothetical protein